MTIGIYRLVFSNTDKVYVGQSVNIEKRFIQHIHTLKTNTANSKLQEAYSLYGQPKLNILLECDIAELDAAEEEAINIFNSVNNGFNIYKYSNQAPQYEGKYGYGNTKYTKEQITDSFNLLVDRPELTHQNISDITGVNAATIGSIAILRTNFWLKQEYPEKYAELEKLVGSRCKASSTVSDKLSAKSQGIVYPSIKDPQGNVYKVDNAYRFAREHYLAGNHLTEVLNGHRKSHKGWKVCQDVQV